MTPTDDTVTTDSTDTGAEPGTTGTAAPGTASTDPAGTTDSTTGADATDAQDSTEDDTGKTAREAAKYRRRLRETEAERDALAERVDALQRAEAERIAATVLERGGGLWAAGATVADMLDDDGNVDPGKVKQHADAAAQQVGLARTRWPDSGQGARGTSGVSTTWAGLIGGKTG